jgi:competence protein ComEA
MRTEEAMRRSYVSLAVVLMGALLAAGAGPVNINTADVKQLMTLEGVGQKVAEKIVEYRTQHGPFRKPEEIRKVQGIGGGLWEKNRERIVVK